MYQVRHRVSNFPRPGVKTLLPRALSQSRNWEVQFKLYSSARVDINFFPSPSVLEMLQNKYHVWGHSEPGRVYVIFSENWYVGYQVGGKELLLELVRWGRRVKVGRGKGEGGGLGVGCGRTGNKSTLELELASGFVICWEHSPKRGWKVSCRLLHKLVVKIKWGSTECLYKL